MNMIKNNANLKVNIFDERFYSFCLKLPTEAQSLKTTFTFAGFPSEIYSTHVQTLESLFPKCVLSFWVEQPFKCAMGCEKQIQTVCLCDKAVCFPCHASHKTILCDSCGSLTCKTLNQESSVCDFCHENILHYCKKCQDIKVWLEITCVPRSCFNCEQILSNRAKKRSIANSSQPRKHLNMDENGSSSFNFPPIRKNYIEIAEENPKEV